MTMGLSSARSLCEMYENLEITLDELHAGQGASWRFERDGPHFSLSPTPAIEPPILIDASHMKRAIDAFAAGAISSAALQEWANLLVMCDAYEMAPMSDIESGKMVINFLHEIASPEVYGPLTQERLGEISAGLRVVLPDCPSRKP